MKDIIYREDAISTVKKWFDFIELNGDICIDGLISLPSAERTGKWVRLYRNGFGNLIGHCEKCGRKYPVDNFCPNCGARMVTE